MWLSFVALPALAAPCPTSFVVTREPSSHVTAAAMSCWGAWGRDRTASQADVHSWLTWWEERWLGAPVEDVPGRIRYGASGQWGLCGWSVQAQVDLLDDQRLESSLTIDLSRWCGAFVGASVQRRVSELGQPFAVAQRAGSAEPGAF